MIFGYEQDFCPEISSAVNLSIIIKKIAQLIGVLLLYMMVYIVTIVLTIYTVNNIFFEMYKNQYAWTVSVAFQSGEVAFGLTFSALFILLWLLLIFIIMNVLLSYYFLLE
jgi:hypothetical protein